MTVVRPREGAMLLDDASIRAIDPEDFETILQVARGQDEDRRDAQRTIHRGLDNGTFVLGDGLRIVLAGRQDEEKETVRSTDRAESATETEMTNVRTLLSHEPRLGDNPSLALQPSIETMVRMHYDRQFGESQGAIVADMYLEKIREAAVSMGTPQQDGAVPPHQEYEAIDPSIRNAHVANTVRNAVISTKKPQTRLQIIRIVIDETANGNLFAAAPELERPIDRNGLVGSGSETAGIVDALIAGGVLTPAGDGYVVASPNRNTEAGEKPNGEAPHPSEKPAEQTAEKPTRQEPPFGGLGNLLSEIGLDVKVGSFDLVSGVEKATKSGNAVPLIAGIAGVLMNFVANSDSPRTQSEKKD